jgi:alkylated DNA repair dioxygenase AlkB
VPDFYHGLLAQQLHRERFFAAAPNQLVANEYQPGQGIFDHIDQDVFGDVVVSISLGSSAAMRFTRADADAPQELLLEPRSLLVLSGEVRWHWKHGIPGRLADTWRGHEYPRSRRISLTFRDVPDPDGQCYRDESKGTKGEV